MSEVPNKSWISGKATETLIVVVLEEGVRFFLPSFLGCAWLFILLWLTRDISYRPRFNSYARIWLHSKHRFLPCMLTSIVFIGLVLIYSNLIHHVLIRYRQAERADLHYISSRLFWDGSALKASIQMQNVGKRPVKPNAIIIRTINVEPLGHGFSQDALFDANHLHYAETTLGIELAPMQTIPVEADYKNAILRCEPSGVVPCTDAQEINNKDKAIYVTTVGHFADEYGSGKTQSCRYFTGFNVFNKEAMANAREYPCDDHNGLPIYSDPVRWWQLWGLLR